MDRLGDDVRRELSRFGAAADIAAVTEQWPEAVGPAIAKNAWPARIARDGTLHVQVSDSVWAFELAQQGAEIAERVGVKAIKFSPGQVPETPELKPVADPPQPTAEHQRQAAEIVAEIDDEELRQSVQKAVVLSLLKGPDDPLF